MTEYKVTLCSLCLKNITDKDFIIIDGATRHMLDVLLLKLRFNGENQEVICNSCKTTLKMALEFKSMCLNTHNMIMPHVNCQKMLPVDLREIYIKENGSSHVTDISYSEKICRLCMQLIKGEVRLIGEEELEAIRNLVPEMNIMVIKDPVVCNSCFDSLCNHNKYLKNCIEVDQRITDMFDNSAKADKTYALSSDLLIKTEDLESEDFEMNEMEMPIKTECVDIKSEEDQGSDTLMLRSNNEAFACKSAESQRLKLISDHKTRSVDICSTKAKSTLLYKCDKCIYETNSNVRFTAHCVKHKNVLQVYKCESCEYETKQKRLLKSHTLRHKGPSEVQIYRCNDCDYKTKYKSDIALHVLKHRDSSLVHIYKCDACDYESRYKKYFNKHQLTHKNPSEVQMYKCDDCDFESKHRDSFMKHRWLHKDPSEVQIYKCDDCDYKTKYRCVIKRHVIKHKDPSQTQTQSKRDLDPSQVKMYKCDTCDYESRYKRSVITHQLTHKDASQVQMYRCDNCDFKSKHKNSIKYHVLQHKDQSQVQMHKCDACNFESRYKSNFIKHKLIHKDASEAQT